jgi:hypothetical protein
MKGPLPSCVAEDRSALSPDIHPAVDVLEHARQLPAADRNVRPAGTSYAFRFNWREAVFICATRVGPRALTDEQRGRVGSEARLPPSGDGRAARCRRPRNGPPRLGPCWVLDGVPRATHDGSGSADDRDAHACLRSGALGALPTRSQVPSVRGSENGDDTEPEHQDRQAKRVGPARFGPLDPKGTQRCEDRDGGEADASAPQGSPPAAPPARGVGQWSPQDPAGDACRQAREADVECQGRQVVARREDGQKPDGRVQEPSDAESGGWGRRNEASRRTRVWSDRAQ